MTAILKSSGLQHAYSLGNIELSAKHGTSRSYDSEDENMTRKHSRFGSSQHLRSSIYSRTDIQEQYCLSERQRSRVKRSKLEGFFGCVSSHTNNPNFFAFCAGNGSSDENIATSAPFHRERAHPRSNGIICSEDDMENSYFRRRPTSFLRSNDPKRFTWMANGEKQRAERVQSCSAYVGGTSKTPPPSALSSGAPRTKHVSFARSHTLTSFDEMSFGRSPVRVASARSQERLIGGLKATNSPEHLQHQHQLHHHVHHTHQHHVLEPQRLQLTSSQSSVASSAQYSQPIGSPVSVVEKSKRNAMKVQATQTDCYPVRKLSASSRMSSPRTVSRTHTATGLDHFDIDERCLPKSLSEALNRRRDQMINDNVVPNADEILHGYHFRSPVHRTQSEEPPRSPRELLPQLPHKTSFDSKYGQEAVRQQLMSVSQASTISGYSTEHTKTSLDSATYSMADSYPDAGSHVNYGECIEFMERATQYPFESNSLPRRKCSHHANEYQTNSLPRSDRRVSQESCGSAKPSLAHIRTHGTFSIESKMGSNQNLADPMLRRYSCGMHDMMAHLNHTDFEAMTALLRRSSMDACYYARQHPYGHEDDDDDDDDDPEDETGDEAEEDEEDSDDMDESESEYCSTCESDSESHGEKEIFIDFKPNDLAVQSPRPQRTKRLQKTMSDGQMLADKRHGAAGRGEKLLGAASEQEIKRGASTATVVYSNLPIKDEGICNNNNLLRPPTDQDINANNRREAFQKRSMSLDDQIDDRSGSGESKGADDKEKYISSTYPSSDSLANDLTRDHSDGLWNESQATVLQIDQSPPDGKTLQPSPNSKRKIMLIQHQQRSSMDTDALDYEDQVIDKPSAQPTATAPSTSRIATVKPNAQKSPSPSRSAIVNAPTISVIPSMSMEAEEVVQHRRASHAAPSSTAHHTDLRRKSVDTSMHHIYANTAEIMKSCMIAKSSSDQQPFAKHSDPMRADVSEGSTNTDDYITCTDASKRGTVPANATMPSITQPPPPDKFSTTQSSHTLTQNGSSFESASSIYSLARVENICEDAVPAIIEDTLPLPKAPSTKPSPSHSISSSSSGSYFSGKKPSKVAAAASPRHSVVVQAQTYAPGKPNTESISDDEKSEKRYSSSGYYESPHDDGELCRPKRHRDFVEDERRRRKEKLRLDIENENVESLTSPTNKACSTFQRISPNDKTALQMLDGGTQAKSKRIRPKTRRSPRARTLNDETPFMHRPNEISPEKLAVDTVHRGHPSKYTHCGAALIATKKHTEHRLKAMSNESVRSVSPGSDSVFYSEIDVHCHHCSKEVEIVAALGENDENLLLHDDSHANIVKPPADFADSPNGPRHSQRLYKKMDKRFRSEERHGERRVHRTRQENTRAKSEERGNEATKEQSLRAAGSSPCVNAGHSFNVRDSVADPEQGIYHGFYRLGSWICIADRDVWRRQDLDPLDRPKELNGRRPSTDSEKDFHKKYQAITHRLVHRKSCVEMYRRQANNSFCTDKTIVVRRESGEFGFRIHGSKPVVVSAIEPETPAESSGLEIGDIVLSVNGVSVIDKSHSEVVKIAHAGSDVLELEVARTIGILSNETLDATSPALYSCYLWRQSNGSQPSAQKWVRRWFCLRTDHCLYYYKSDQDTQPVGALLLTNHSVENCSSDIGRPFAFRITSNDGPPLYLAADTEETANRWIAVLGHAAKQSDPWLEVSTRNLRLPPPSVPRPDCFGFLLKLGNRWRAWSKRYCVLKDACLYFYLDGGSKNALGMACLQGYKVQPATNAFGKKHAFEIAPPEPKLRHYCFSTDSDMDKKRWIAALEYSIDRWMKS